MYSRMLIGGLLWGAWLIGGCHAHALDLNDTTGYSVNIKSGRMSCGTSCRLERVEKALASVTKHLLWIESVANQQRLDREITVNSDQCHETCTERELTKYGDLKWDQQSTEQKSESMHCHKDCSKTFKVPGGC